ncbi:MAG TPA: esterase [Betaproteobacteria bacterium]|nr:esterase [Betaproteobacteria bacterium]
MPIDAAAKSLIDALNAQGFKSFEQMSVEEVRGAVASFTGLQATPQEVARVVNTVYPGPGGNQDLRIYIPQAPAPLPVVVYFHGGGFVAGGLSVVDEPCRALADDAGVIVVAATYRLAPEHKFPAATDDAFAALKWVAKNIQQYGGDGSRIVVMGDSAGGNLAAVTALRARDENGPDIRAQILIYPVIDSTAKLPSRAEFKDGYLITAAGLDWFWAHYLASPEDAQNPLASPSKAASLAGLPPALVLSTEYEVARDEGEAYGKQLAAAGVDTQAIRFDGLIHGVYWMSGAVPRSKELHDAIVKFLGR